MTREILRQRLWAWALWAVGLWTLLAIALLLTVALPAQDWSKILPGPVQLESTRTKSHLLVTDVDPITDDIGTTTPVWRNPNRSMDLGTSSAAWQVEGIYFHPLRSGTTLVPVINGSFRVRMPGYPDLAPGLTPWILMNLHAPIASFLVHNPSSGAIQQVTCMFGGAFGCSVMELQKPLEK